jgi:hypothetical protein
MLDSVPKHHDEVRSIQPTWHCLLRFRQRVKLPPGADEAAAALRASLERSDLTRMAPAWVTGRDRGAQMWALDGELAFPLTPGLGGEWIAPTCLVRGA